jgi:hypothetical protein
MISIDLAPFYRRDVWWVHLLLIVAMHIFYIVFLSITLSFGLNLILVCICFASLLLQKYAIKCNWFKVFICCGLCNEISVGIWASGQKQIFYSLDPTQKIVDIVCICFFIVCNIWVMLPWYWCCIQLIKWKLGGTSSVQSFVQMV